MWLQGANYLDGHSWRRPTGAAAHWADSSLAGERIQFISHQQKQVLLVDCSQCSAAQVETIVRSVPEYLTVQPLASVLVLVDFTGASIDGEAIRTMKESAVCDKPYVKRSAWIGAENFPEAFYKDLKSYSGRELPKFTTRQDALNWLVAN